MKTVYVKPQAIVEVQYMPIANVLGVTAYHMNVIVTDPETGRFRVYFAYPQEDQKHATYLFAGSSAEFDASKRKDLTGDIEQVTYTQGMRYADMTSLFHKLQGDVLLKHLPYALIPETDKNPMGVTSDTYAAYLVKSIGGTASYQSLLGYRHIVPGVSDQYVNRFQ